MKTNTVQVFYADVTKVVDSFYAAFDVYLNIKRSYDAVKLNQLIENGTDFGVSAGTYPRLIPFFDDLKHVTTTLVASLNEVASLKRYYDALMLSTLITDGADLGDGTTGLELKTAVTSLVAADIFLVTNTHYDNLCQMYHTAKRQSATWLVGVTGKNVKDVIGSIAALDAFLLANSHWTNIDKLI